MDYEYAKSIKERIDGLMDQLGIKGLKKTVYSCKV